MDQDAPMQLRAQPQVLMHARPQGWRAAHQNQAPSERWLVPA
jgi:hypothetical protein